MYINKRTYTFIIALLLLITFANASYSMSDDDFEDTIDKQNNLLYEEIMKLKKDKGNPMGDAINEVNKRTGSTISLKGLAQNIEHGSIKLALLARKYIVPISILVILFNISMLSITGAKNLKNRKKYIWSSVIFYILFLMILNFPIILLWNYSTDMSSGFSFNKFYTFVNNVSIFLKENSLIFSIIILSYGLINYISSGTDLPKRLASSFMIKMSFLLFVLFQTLPFILKLAV